MRRSDRSVPWAIAEVALGLAVVSLPWALGGAPDWSLWVLLGTASLALGAWCTGAARHGRRFAWHPVVLLPLAAGLVAALQLVPLPPALLRLVAPVTAELRVFALEPLGLDGWRPVSLDPPSTARVLARSLAFASLVFVAVQLGRIEGARRRVLAVIGASGLSVALCGIGHQLASEEALFGLYQFSRAVGVITPFGNVNHLAAFLTITSTVALGLALSADSRDSLVGWALAALTMGVVVFLSLSRGGIGSFVAAWGAVAALVLARKAGGLRGATPWIIIGATMAFAALVAAEQLVERALSVSTLQRLQATKLDLWPMFARGAAAAWPAGMGLGAFELGFSRFQDQQLDVTFTHPENVALQWLAEAGVPLAAGLAGLAAWVLWRVWKGTRGRTLERAVVIGVVGVFLHDVFDFALELNAVPTVALVALGVVSDIPGDERRALRPSLLGLFAGLVACALLLAWRGLPGHRAAEEHLAEAIRGQRPVAEVTTLARGLIDRHPADYVLYADMAAFSAARGDAQNALAWVNRLLFLRPGDARAHVAAGRALLRLGKRAQALGEFKMSFELGDASALDLALAVASKEGDFERLFVPQRGFVTQAWRTLVARGKEREARQLLDRALIAAPDEVVRLEAQVLDATTVAQSGDAAKALALLDALPEAEQKTQDFLLMRCRVLAKLSRTDEAIDLLKRAFAAEPSSESVALTLSELYAAQGRRTEARDVLARVRLLVTTQAARFDLLLREAALCEADSRWGRALELLQSASRLEPGRADLHYRMANVFERMGSPHAALDEVRRGRLVDTPEGAKAQDAWVSRLEALDQASLGPPPELTTP